MKKMCTHTHTHTHNSYYFFPHGSLLIHTCYHQEYSILLTSAIGISPIGGIASSGKLLSSTTGQLYLSVKNKIKQKL